MPGAVNILIPFEFYSSTLLVIECVTFMHHAASLVMTSRIVCLLHSNCFSCKSGHDATSLPVIKNFNMTFQTISYPITVITHLRICFFYNNLLIIYFKPFVLVLTAKVLPQEFIKTRIAFCVHKNMYDSCV